MWRGEPQLIFCLRTRGREGGVGSRSEKYGWENGMSYGIRFLDLCPISCPILSASPLVNAEPKIMEFRNLRKCYYYYYHYYHYYYYYNYDYFFCLMFEPPHTTHPISPPQTYYLHGSPPLAVHAPPLSHLLGNMLLGYGDRPSSAVHHTVKRENTQKKSSYVLNATTPRVSMVSTPQHFFGCPEHQRKVHYVVNCASQ